MKTFVLLLIRLMIGVYIKFLCEPERFMVDTMQNKNSFKPFNFLLAVFIFFSMMSAATYAAQLNTISSKINQESKAVVISGNHSGGAGRLVTVSVAKQDMPDNTYYWAEKRTVENGFFEFKFTMDALNDLSGYYTVNIGGTNVAPVTSNYLFINAAEDSIITTSINSFTQTDQVIELLDEKDYLCGIDRGINSKFSTIMNKSLVYSSMLGRNFENITAFKRAFDEAVAISKFNEATVETAQSVISNYAEDLGIEIDEDSYYFKIRNDVGKNIVYSAVVGKNFSLKNASAVVEVFESASALGVVNDVDTTNRDMLIVYINELNQKGYTNISTAVYNSLSDTDKISVIKKTLDAKPYSSFASFVNAFSKAVSDVLDEIKGPSGGGGGGGASKPTTVVTGDNIQISISPTVTQPLVFSDIEGVEWAKESISYLADRNIINGVGNNMFEPNRNITRSEFVKILVSALNITHTSYDINFSDVVLGMWQYDYIAAAKANGLVNGVSETVFGVNDYITREQMCSIVYRAIVSQGIDVKPLRDAVRFNDNDSISEYAREAVAFLYGADIVNGVENNMFAPAAAATRAMAAKIIYEVLEGGGLK